LIKGDIIYYSGVIFSLNREFLNMVEKEQKQRRRLSKGFRTFLREEKAKARKNGGDWTEVLFELRLPDLVTLVRESGVGPQRLRDALRDLDIGDIDSVQHLLAISEDIGSNNFPYKNERLLDATQQALRKQVNELERKERGGIRIRT